MEVEFISFSVRQLPDKATEHLHGERGEEGKPVYETMKSAIQVFFFLFKISQIKVLTFFIFSEHVGPSHGHLKPQPSILKAECNISWFLLDV